VREADGDVWYVSGQVFEAWGTAARTAADYDIALVDKSGDMFVGTMDTNISAGYYWIVTHQQAGGAPADTDPATFQEYGYWTGSTWYPGRVAWQDVVTDHTTEANFGGELGGIDPNVTAIKAITDILPALQTTVASPNDVNNFTITAGLDANDVYEGSLISVQDAGDSHWETRLIVQYEVGRDVTVDQDFGFTPAGSDEVVIWNNAYFPASVSEALPADPPMEFIYIDNRT
jgi:hypothetical protein